MSHRSQDLSLILLMCFSLDGFYHCVFGVPLGSLLHPHTQGPHAGIPVDALVVEHAYLHGTQPAKQLQERQRAISKSKIENY